MISIYVVLGLDNGKLYFGQTSRSVQHRWKKHLEAARYKSRSTYFANAIKKHGADRFTVCKVDEAENQGQADEKERLYIALFESNNRECGYNSTIGGESGGLRTEESRRKVSLALTGGRRTAEQRKRMSEAKLGKPGHPHTEESRRKLSLAHLGKKVSEATRQKLSAIVKNRIWTPEQRAKHAAAMGAEETRRKLSESHRGQIAKHKKPLPESWLATMFRSGVSIDYLAHGFSVNRAVIERRLRSLGVNAKRKGLPYHRLPNEETNEALFGTRISAG